MLSCWNEVVPHRPSFANLQTKLDHILSAEGNNPYMDFSINPNSLCYQVADEMDMPNNLLHVTQSAAANRRSVISSKLGSDLSVNTVHSSSKSIVQDSPASSMGGSDIMKGCASPTKPHATNPLGFLEDEGSSRRPRSMMLLGRRSPTHNMDEDRLLIIISLAVEYRWCSS